MRALRTRHREVLDTQRSVATVASLGVPDAAGDVDRLIDRGGSPQLADDALTACVVLDDVTEPGDDLGFDLAGSTKGGPIVGVDETGPAQAAGLRNGQFLRSARTGDRADRSVEIGIEADDGVSIRLLHYLPTGTPCTRRHASIGSGLGEDDRSACLHALDASPGAVTARVERSPSP